MKRWIVLLFWVAGAHLQGFSQGTWHVGPSFMLISGLRQAEHDPEGNLEFVELRGRSGPGIGVAVQYSQPKWSILSDVSWVRYGYAGAPPITTAGEVWVQGLLATPQARYTLWTADRQFGLHMGAGPSFWLTRPQIDLDVRALPGRASDAPEQLPRVGWRIHTGIVWDRGPGQLQVDLGLFGMPYGTYPNSPNAIDAWGAWTLGMTYLVRLPKPN